MLTTTLLNYLLSTTAALALPQRLSQRDTTIYQTNVTYYQGSAISGQYCGDVAVSSGNITSGVCNTAYTYSLSIQPLATRDCEFVLYAGSSDCGSDATGTSNTFLPAGGHQVCVTTGVLDGGAHIHASGVLNCDVDID